MQETRWPDTAHYNFFHVAHKAAKINIYNLETMVWVIGKLEQLEGFGKFRGLVALKI